MGLCNCKPHLLGSVLSKTLHYGHACHKECSSPVLQEQTKGPSDKWEEYMAMADLLKLSRPTINSGVDNFQATAISGIANLLQAIYRWSIYFQGVPCLYERDFCWSKSMAYVSDKMISMVNGKCCMPHAPHSKPLQFSLPPRRKKHRPKRSKSFPVPYLERLARCYCVDRVMR